MSGLLAELRCPYSALTTGDVTKRLLNANNCVLLMSFLISELQSSRMMAVNHPNMKLQEAGGSQIFVELKGICMALGMSKPPANITMFQFFSGIEKKLKEALSKVPPSHVGEPLMKKVLGPVHWEKIEAINQALVNEYEVRRKMLLKRLDVTVQSFGWSERAKTRADKLSKVYHPLRVALANRSQVCVAHLFAARDDLSKILRTSSGRIREKTACAINKRCPHGRNARMVPRVEEEEEDNSTLVEEEGEEEVVTISSRVVEGVMREEGAEVAEETTEETKLKATGKTVINPITRMEVIEGVMEEEVIMEPNRGLVIKEEDTREASKDQATLEVATRVEEQVISKKDTTKMEGGTRKEEGGVLVEVGDEEEEEVVVKEVVGVEEEDRILTKVVSLSSSSSRGAISTIKLASAREDSSQVEERLCVDPEKVHNSLSPEE
ncbi:hypothetical protein DNTS_028641 [Danionella cerebrum]|nr:hypothetical protein DNTS_028641 [Danionella translucida]